MADTRYIDDHSNASRVLRVSRGLFVFRYVSSRGGIEAPEVMVSPAPGPAVEIISADNSSRPILCAPGDAVVIRAEQDASILATVMPVRPGSSRDAQFVFERIVQSPSLSAPSRDLWFAPTQQQPRAITSPGILAHVARRGDVTISPGEWVCGPQLPMVIEGLQVMWPNRPSDVDIQIGCSINARGRRSFVPSPSGTFVGTRGKAAPIVSVSLSLVGHRASTYRLSCEALFLGAQVQMQEGLSVDFSGPSGLEPLVGLRISVLDAVSAATGTNSLYNSAQTAHRTRNEFGGRNERADFTSKANSIAGHELAPLELSDMVPSISASKSGRVRVFRASRPTSHT